MTEHSKPQPAADQSELDPNSLAAIRNLMATEEPVKAVPVKERVQAKVAQVQTTTAEASTPKRGRLSPLSPQRSTSQKSTKSAKPQQSKDKGVIPHLVANLKAKVLGYRPTVKHVLLAGLVLLVLFRPWLIFGLLFLLAFVFTGIFLILGYDGFWRRVMGIARWYARKHPSRSVELHRKLDGFAMKFDAFLDRFPEGSVDGLYLPDFGDLAAEEAQHDAVLERRFENLRKSEA